jgi:hypothetical protein
LTKQSFNCKKQKQKKNDLLIFSATFSQKKKKDEELKGGEKKRVQRQSATNQALEQEGSTRGNKSRLWPCTVGLVMSWRICRAKKK